MSNYRITFVKNNIISCIETDQRLLDDEKSYYFVDPGHAMAFVLLRAYTQDEATAKAKSIYEKIKDTDTDSLSGFKF